MMAGTSMAAPVVTGLLYGLVFEKPSKSNTERGKRVRALKKIRACHMPTPGRMI